mgnify:FL=1
MYYLAPADRPYSATEIKRKTGLDPESTGIVALNFAGVYPVVDVANPHDTRLYTVALTYTVNGTGADQTWTATAKPLADAKVAGSDAQKEKYEAEAVAVQDDYGNLTLIAAAAKTSAQRSASETAIIDSLKTIATNLSNDLASIDAATDVDAINAIVNP